MADEQYKSFLNSWRLSEYIDNFEIEGITDESFLLLDEDTIKALIPKSGPRLIFKDKYNVLKQNNVSENGDKIPQYDPILETENISTPSTSTVDDSIYEFVADDSFSQQFFATSSTTKESQKNNTEKDALTHTSVTPLREIQQVCFAETSEWLENGPPSKKRSLGSVFPKGLEAVLAKYPDGQLLIQSKGKLTEVLRNKLTKIIISELFGQFGLKNIKGELLQEVATEIKSIFPSENSETYFIPYNNAQKKGPKGKLYTKFINTRASLKLTYVCSNRNEEKLLENIEDTCTNISQTEIEGKHLEFLQIGTEPLTRVFDAWESTFKLRGRLYLNSPLSKVYDDFPCLKLNEGLELIETDFNKKHPDSIDIIYQWWTDVKNAILAEAQERKITYLSSADVDSSAKAILILPYLFSPVTIKKSRKGCIWRPSRSEVQESFFLHIENFAELDEKIKKRREKLKSYALTVQPFGVVVGDLSAPNYIIVVDEVQYRVETGIRALELLFKLFHGLDIEYPSEASHVWEFIQEAVFKIKNKHNKISSSTSTLLGDIQYHLEKAVK